MEHIYLMYHVAQDSDTMEVTYAAGVNPKLVFVCQNIADVNSIRPDYKMTVLPQGCRCRLWHQTLATSRIRMTRLR